MSSKNRGNPAKATEYFLISAFNGFDLLGILGCKLIGLFPLREPSFSLFQEAEKAARGSYYK
jgi:hypothetical protein